MELFKTQKRSEVCNYGGYSYRVDRINADNKTWRCMKIGCNGRIWTNPDNTNPVGFRKFIGITPATVLVMEFCEWGQINDYNYFKAYKLDPDDACRKLGKLYSEMIFIEGVVHCDPHPGNVLAHRHPSRGLQIVLLDHGLYTMLDEVFRLHYVNLWLALLKADLNEIRKASLAMGIGDLYGLFVCVVTSRSWNSVLSGVDKQSTMITEENKEIRAFVRSQLPRIVVVLSRVPRPMLLIFKINDLLRGIEYSLKVQKNAISFVQMSKCCIGAVHDYVYNHCGSFTCRFATRTRKYLAYFRISMYEWFLNVSEFVTHLRMQLRRM